MLVFQAMVGKGKYIYAVILVAVFAAYSNSFTAPFIFDDTHTIVRNFGLRDLTNLKEVFTSDSPGRPFLFLTFAVNFALGGLDPFGYHVVNLTLHFFASVLVFLIISNLLTRVGKEYETWALIGTLFFAVHPLNVEAVTYIASRSSVMATFFFLLSFWLVITSHYQISVRTILALAAMLLAVFTKEIAITLPPLLTLFIWQYEGREKFRRAAPLLLLFWVVIPMFFLYRTMVLGHPMEPPDPNRELNSKIYFLTQLVVVPFGYIPRIFAPVNQVFDADSEWKYSFLDWQVMGGGLTILCVLAVAFKCFQTNRTVSFSILWFFGVLSVTSSFWPILDAYVERRLYIALPAIALLISYGGYYFAGRFPGIEKKLMIFAITLLIIFGGLTFSRNQLFGSPKLVWEDTIAKTWGKWRLYAGLASEYIKDGNYEKAEDLIKFASLKFPDKAEIKLTYCWLLGSSGRFDEMASVLSSIKPKRPEEESKFLNYKGILAGRQKDFDAALAYMKRALILDPENVDARANTAILLKMAGRREDALAFLRKAIRTYPYEPDYHFQLANILLDSGSALAEEEYRRTLELDPFHVGARKALLGLRPSNDPIEQ